MHGDAEQMSTAQYLSAGVLLVALALMYTIAFFWYKAAYHGRGDLRARRRRGGMGWSRWFKQKAW